MRLGIARAASLVDLDDIAALRAVLSDLGDIDALLVSVDLLDENVSARSYYGGLTMLASVHIIAD